MSTERIYGVLLRVYTPKPEEVADRVERALKHVHHVFDVAKEFPALHRVVLVVPRDYDCGLTYQALSKRIDAEGLSSLVSMLTPTGHHSCEALNFGLTAAHLESSHALIVSGKAMSYLTLSVLRAFDEAFACGAKVVGLAVDELHDIVLEGRIQNTFAAWDIKALQQVGDFDSKGGVEEIAPLVRLIREFGQCIAPIDTVAGTLEVLKSETARARHEEVMTTKLVRQQAELDRVGSNFAEIKSGIMPGYQYSVW